MGSWFNNNSSMSFETFSRIVELSDYTLNDAEMYVISLMSGRTGSKVFLNFPITVNREFGIIVGHILGDGSIDKKYLQPFYTNSNLDLVKEFTSAMKQIFGIKPRIWIQDAGNFKDIKTKWIERIHSFENIPKNSQIGLFYPKICGVLLHSILGLFAYGKQKQITEQIKSTNNQFKLGLIKAFFDDESSVDVKSYNLRVFQDNKQLLENLQNLLLDVGISSNPIRSYIKKDKLRYYFNITKRRNFFTYYNSIGFVSKVKNERLKSLACGR